MILAHSFRGYLVSGASWQKKPVTEKDCLSTGSEEAEREKDLES